ncbi:D-2-hydroxyacid dehydrogenase [candidate division KSB3 bacterium]|uniref:D-2-hydroxyacid dehydrogenase n=1 Tax=candidate division KSB3 bacterium TaxID=2044937 RepID=A0A9D5JYV2_9BACT|nr:D-2-hydroxyacid dehydrogenase [candidate division KSB3 bacterium]MBD3326695.1 D-2-hydroxyacid dehydrogenase [candidate division KSB3 bacterium]
MTAQNTLLILTQDADRYAELLKPFALPDLEFVACDSLEAAERYIDQCNIILGAPPLTAPLLDQATRLEWVQSTYAGVEAFLYPQRRSDYVLTGVKGVFEFLISEYVFGYILARERHLFETFQQQQQKIWQKTPYQSLQGKLLGICGLGTLGRHLAHTAKVFGMNVWGYKRSPVHLPEVERIFTATEFQEFLAQPDYVVITLPSTPETQHLFDDAAFQAMKPSAMLINVGRGQIVSEQALIHALTQQRIHGAVLDVFEEEPLPPESPLWTLPNVLITPHNAAFSFPEDIVQIFCDNYRRFVNHEPLLYEVDFQKGY